MTFFSKRRSDSRDLKAGSVVSDLNGYYDSQNIIVLPPATSPSSAASGPLKTKLQPPPAISCILHHSANHEGGAGLTLCSTQSSDGGKTWTPLRPVEDNDTQSHDGYQLLVGHRVYLFYGWNAGSQPPNAAPEQQLSRTDMQADQGFWMKWSDDGGKTWDCPGVAAERVAIPIPRTAIDLANPWAGDPTIGAFCCDKPQLIDGQCFFAFQKTRDGNGESYGSEAFVLRCNDFLEKHERGEMEQMKFELLPAGGPAPGFDYSAASGMQTPRGLLLGEEVHVLQIIGAYMLAFWRTELGFLDSRISDNYGKTWREPAQAVANGCGVAPLVFDDLSESASVASAEFFKSAENDRLAAEKAVNGLVPAENEAFARNVSEYLQSAEYLRVIRNNHSVIRNPRGAITPFQMSDRFYCLLYYNNGRTERLGYVGRLVAWLVVGHVPYASESYRIKWSQPEVCLYWDGVCLDDREEWNEDWAIVDGPGYADFQQAHPDKPSELLLVESNKLTVRFHAVDPYLVDCMKLQLFEEDKYDVAVHTTSSTAWDGVAAIREEAVSESCVQDWKRKATGNNNDLVAEANGDALAVAKLRCPVLPDLRSGGGFSVRVVLPTAELIRASSTDVLLVDGLTVASAALDEPCAPGASIQKGYTIRVASQNHGAADEQKQLVFRLTDGFKLYFEYAIDLLQVESNRSFYQGGSAETASTTDPVEGARIKVDSFCFTFDGGPKVATCVVNQRLYNGAPCGWEFFPREFGEVGGAEVAIVSDACMEFAVYDRALSVAEACYAMTR